MMDILMYLFETYIHSDMELAIDQGELEEELLQAGFERNDIYKALDWLEQLADLQDEKTEADRIECAPTSMRVYSKQEMLRLTTKHRGFLLFLEQVKVLTPETREIAIDRIMELESPDLHLDDLKWVILMVLFNTPGNESAYTQMEELLYTVEQGYLH